MSVQDEIDKIGKCFLQDLEKVQDSSSLDQLRIQYLGKKGPIQGLMPSLKNCSKEERPLLGKLINELKVQVTSTLEEKKEALSFLEKNQRLSEEKVDVTLPGKKKFLGRPHPIQALMQEALEVLSSMGFDIQVGPDLESDYYNFEALNFPPDHPAREMQDTYYLTTDKLLRTHTSNVQVRIMEKNTPPIRVVAPGRCFRNETVSSRSYVFFHQIEGFYIDEGVSFADLLATMQEFWSRFFNQKIEIRSRPSYFPFVEPGMEIDVHCTNCKGRGCKICKQTGWLEVAGAGLIHPEVLKSGGIDPEKYSGYAWGIGIERLALLKYEISDIRRFTENDLRFLSQFP